jgi:hypothetical protein
MIAIDDVLLTDQIVEEQFVCDLSACKGACCVDGDAGAPLQSSELKEVNAALPHVLPYMRKEGIEEIGKQGNYVYNEEFGWVTPTVEGKICAFGIYDKEDIVKCAFEQAYNDGKIKWKKPISCHLFPILVEKSSDGKTTYANYSPRKHNCKAACSLGKKLKVPVYQFLQEPLTRKFGKAFYEALDATAKHMEQQKSKK